MSLMNRHLIEQISVDEENKGKIQVRWYNILTATPIEIPYQWKVPEVKWSQKVAIIRSVGAVNGSSTDVIIIIISFVVIIIHLIWIYICWPDKARSNLMGTTVLSAIPYNETAYF